MQDGARTNRATHLYLRHNPAHTLEDERKAVHGHNARGHCYLPGRDVVLPPLLDISLDESPLFLTSNHSADVTNSNASAASHHRRPTRLLFAYPADLVTDTMVLNEWRDRKKVYASIYLSI